jgi:hypothetical protein
MTTEAIATALAMSSSDAVFLKVGNPISGPCGEASQSCPTRQSYLKAFASRASSRRITVSS